MTSGDQVWIGELLAYWFGALTPKQWFGKDDAVDAELRRRFLATYEQVAGGPEVDTALGLPAAEAMLARVIALDQLPRNMFRGTPRAFASDTKALAAARLIVDHGLDKGMSREQRLFAYLPFEHSEDAADQETSVRLFEALGDAEWTRFAVRHKEIIDRFGRFPHRNAILGRPSTADEIAFLQEPHSAF